MDGLLSIGEFSARSRLSPKALRLYDERGLVVPARIEPASGYRWYDPAQLGRAQLVRLLRGLELPLAGIGEILALPAAEASAAVRAHVEADRRAHQVRRRLADHVCLLLDERSMTMNEADTYQVKVRRVPERAVLSASRRVHADRAGEVLGDLLGRMRGSGLVEGGADACPFVVHHAEVSADSDGPLEVVRPMADPQTAHTAAADLGDVQATLDPAHDEAYVVLTLSETRGAGHLLALEALQAHVTGLGRLPSGAPRQVMIADWRTAGPDEPAALLAVPLRPA